MVWKCNFGEECVFDVFFLKCFFCCCLLLFLLGIDFELVKVLLLEMVLFCDIFVLFLFLMKLKELEVWMELLLYDLLLMLFLNGVFWFLDLDVLECDEYFEMEFFWKSLLLFFIKFCFIVSVEFVKIDVYYFFLIFVVFFIGWFIKVFMWFLVLFILFSCVILGFVLYLG